MDPLNPIQNGFVNGRYAHSHFYAACTSWHGSSVAPAAMVIRVITAHTIFCYGDHSPYNFLKIAPLPSRYVPNA